MKMKAVHLVVTAHGYAVIIVMPAADIRSSEAVTPAVNGLAISLCAHLQEEIEVSMVGTLECLGIMSS